MFPARLVEKTLRLPGAQHAFLKQICAPEAESIRASLQRRLDAMPAAVQDRVSSLLGSLDNRRFFQGFSEIVVLDSLLAAGWEVGRVLPPQPRFEIRRPGSGPLLVSVLATLQNLRPGGEALNRARLRDALSRVAAAQRFVVLVRRWLPTDLEPEPVRRAVELWLARVADGQWEGRYATYEDDTISLEFSLTGEPVQDGVSPLADVIGPFYAHRTMEAIEPRVVREIDHHRLSEHRHTPLLVVCATDARWLINSAYILDFLYGRPARTSVGPDGLEIEVPATAGGACVFRDPVYRGVAGLVLADRIEPGSLRMRAWLNPWCDGGPGPLDLGIPTFAAAPEPEAAGRRLPTPDGAGAGSAVLRRFGGDR